MRASLQADCGRCLMLIRIVWWGFQHDTQVTGVHFDEMRLETSPDVVAVTQTCIQASIRTLISRNSCGRPERIFHDFATRC